MADDRKDEKSDKSTDDEERPAKKSAGADARSAKKPAPKPPVDEEDDEDEDDEEEEDDEDEDEVPARAAARRAVPESRAGGRPPRPGVKAFLPWALAGMAMVGAYAYIEKPNDIRMHAFLAVLGISCVIYAFIGIGSINEVES